MLSLSSHCETVSVDTIYKTTTLYTWYKLYIYIFSNFGSLLPHDMCLYFCLFLHFAVACHCAMPPKREVISVHKGDPLTLTCEWQDCQEVFEVMTDFLLHVTDHLEATATSVKHDDECRCHTCSEQ